MKNHSQEKLIKLLSSAFKEQTAGNLCNGKQMYLQILKNDPQNFDATHLLGVNYAQQQLLNKAIPLLKKATAIKPDSAVAHFNLAKAFSANQDHQSAVHCYQSAIKLNPQYTEAWIQLGVVQLNAQDFKTAKFSFQNAINSDANNLNAYLGLGRALRGLDEQELAIENFEQALKVLGSENMNGADHELAYASMMEIGGALSSLGQPSKALVAFDRALDIRPEDEHAMFNKGIAYRDLGKKNEALEAFNVLYQKNSTDVKAIHALAVMFGDIDRKEEAAICCKRAIDLAPDFSHAYDTMAALLMGIKDSHNALLHHLKAIELDPKVANFYINFGNSLSHLGQYPEAKIAYEEALRLEPNSLKGQWNLVTLELKCTNFEKAWDGYKLRWEIPDLKLKPIETTKPQWVPDSQFHHVLVWGEQGVGDEIMFACLLDQLSSQVPHISVYADKRLVSLIQRSFPNIRCISSLSDLDGLNYDSQIPIGDLPKYLCKSVDDFKNIRPAYLLPDYDLTSQIQKSYKKEGKVLCGISWKSNNPKQGPDRSIELKEFISGLNIPEFEFINLQYGDVTQDLEQVQQELGIKILQAKEVDNFSNIDGLAALIDACDLIISIDNSTVHIAGAIGKPVWVLLNANPDWRWFLERSDSLWYASATLFRQEIPGQWQTVLKQAKDKAMDILQGNLSA